MKLTDWEIEDGPRRDDIRTAMVFCNKKCRVEASIVTSQLGSFDGVPMDPGTEDELKAKQERAKRVLQTMFALALPAIDFEKCKSAGLTKINETDVDIPELKKALERDRNAHRS